MVIAKALLAESKSFIPEPGSPNSRDPRLAELGVLDRGFHHSLHRRPQGISKGSRLASLLHTIA